jgi:hypothetical protein
MESTIKKAADGTVTITTTFKPQGDILDQEPTYLKKYPLCRIIPSRTFAPSLISKDCPSTILSFSKRSFYARFVTP